MKVDKSPGKVASQKKIPGKSHIPEKKTRAPWIPLFFILPVSLVVLIPCFQNGFTNWDDPTYILDNPLIRQLSGENLKRIFTEVYFSNYQPLHILSYALEYHFFKDQATGYHAVSVIMHLVNTGLVFWLAWLLTGKRWVTLLTALFFGIHPMHVESIAWAAERKDLLYAMFFFLSMIFYVRYIQFHGKFKYLCYAFLFFVLSIFSKAMAASLVPVLVLLDFFYRRKFGTRLFLEKVPFFALALIMGIISVNASKASGSIAGSEQFSFFERFLFANFNLFEYFFKLTFPVNLSAYYPYPEKTSGMIPWYYYASPLFSIGLLSLSLITMKKSRILITWTGFFVVTVFLVLQLLPVGPAIFSERYSYVPSFGFFLLLGFGFEKLSQQPPKGLQNLKTILWGITGIWSLWLCMVTFQRCQVWKDSITLWDDVINQFDKALHAYNNRADAYYKTGKYELAIKDLNIAISLSRDYAMAWYNRGNAYGQLGKFNEAFNDLDKSIQLDPKNANAYNKRGQAYAVLGNKEAAFNDFNTALSIDPANPEIYYNIGITWINSGNKEEACKALSKAVQMNYQAARAPFADICQ